MRHPHPCAISRDEPLTARLEVVYCTITVFNHRLQSLDSSRKVTHTCEKSFANKFCLVLYALKKNFSKNMCLSCATQPNRAQKKKRSFACGVRGRCPLVGCHEHRRQRRRAGWSRGNLSGRPRATQSDHVTLVRFLRRLWLSFLSTSLLLLGCRFRVWSTLQATRTSVLSPLRLFMLQRQVSGRNGQYSTFGTR